MRNAIRIPMCCMLIATLPTHAFAQYCADPTTNPCMQAKQSSNIRAYQMSVYSPGECDDETITAATAWSNAGSNFALEDYSYHSDSYVNAGTKLDSR